MLKIRNLWVSIVLILLCTGLPILSHRNTTYGSSELVALQEEDIPAICRVFYSDHSKRQKHNVKNLHLYQLLKPVETRLKKTIDELTLDDANLSELEALFKASSMCSQVLTSMERLVLLFNTKSYEAISQFKWQFLSVCQMLKEHGADTKPRHLRQLAPRFKKFHAAIFNYFYTHREFMDAQEVELFQEMNRFCSGLRFCVLPGADDYFDFSFGDLFVDALVFKPAEWAADHKLLVAAGIIIIAASVWYLHSKNTPRDRFDIRAEKAIIQPACSNQCGAYAIANSLLLQADDPAAVLERAKTLDMPELFEQTRQELARADEQERLNIFPESPVLLYPDEVMTVMQEPLFMNRLKAALGLDHLVNNDDCIVLQGLPAESVLAAAQYQQLHASVAAFSQHAQPQTTICYQGNLDRLEDGHWVAMRIEPQRDQSTELCARICDSSGSFFGKDFSKNPYVRGVMDLYAANNMFQPAVYHGIKSVQAANEIYGSNDFRGTVADRASSSMRDYTQGIHSILQASPAIFTNAHDPAYQACAISFIDCRSRALANNQTVIQVPREALAGQAVPPAGSAGYVELDVTQAQDFSGYLNWFAQQTAELRV